MEAKQESVQTIYDIQAKRIDGKAADLSEFRGKTLLIVNVASKCGFTGQYDGLEALYKKYKDKNFEILGFPCNQFGGQEPGSDADVKSFCSLTFGVSFPLFSKVDVNGPNAHPLYQFLKAKAPGILGTEQIKWNFTKFLVSKTGEVLERYAPTTAPGNIEQDLAKVL